MFHLPVFFIRRSVLNFLLLWSFFYLELSNNALFLSTFKYLYVEYSPFSFLNMSDSKPCKTTEEMSYETKVIYLLFPGITFSERPNLPFHYLVININHPAMTLLIPSLYDNIQDYSNCLSVH